MASPTLSFAAPTSFSGSAGGNVGLEVRSSINVVFDIDESDIQQAVDELLAQAIAAGFEMEELERLSSPGLLYVSADRFPELAIGASPTERGASASVSLLQ